MPPRKPLRSVKADETPTEPPKPVTVTAAAQSGDELALLIALRERVAKALDETKTPARDLAALTKRLTDITREIAAIRAEQADDDDANEPDEEFDAEAL